MASHYAPRKARFGPLKKIVLGILQFVLGLAVLLARSGGKKNVFIGDRCFDADAARANGIPCIGVLWGCGSREELKEHGACMLAHTPKELEELLLRGPRGE